tara:strand:+ start:2758 stop:2976 length:219 start_codon:yes stop_codon:yes gene_type:complete
MTNKKIIWNLKDIKNYSFFKTEFMNNHSERSILFINDKEKSTFYIDNAIMRVNVHNYNILTPRGKKYLVNHI